jgi:hypothetical protein
MASSGDTYARRVKTMSRIVDVIPPALRPEARRKKRSYAVAAIKYYLREGRRPEAARVARGLLVDGVAAVLRWRNRTSRRA